MHLGIVRNSYLFLLLLLGWGGGGAFILHRIFSRNIFNCSLLFGQLIGPGMLCHVCKCRKREKYFFQLQEYSLRQTCHRYLNRNSYVIRQSHSGTTNERGSMEKNSSTRGLICKDISCTKFSSYGLRNYCRLGSSISVTIDVNELMGHECFKYVPSSEHS
jgi:hypothetical protein